MPKLWIIFFNILSYGVIFVCNFIWLLYLYRFVYAFIILFRGVGIAWKI